MFFDEVIKFIHDDKLLIFYKMNCKIYCDK